MSTPTSRTPLFNGTEIGIVAGSIVGFVILAIIAVSGGIWTLLILGPILLVALVLGAVALTIWLLMKFGTVIVRNGVIAAHEELARRGAQHTAEP
ncbi:hypothetical protein [Microbacterium sp.]|uniref:hypothetical protein n=1 Tax=Microbacterium sp. TaxID=51671 RepID=UPI003A8CD25A